MKITLALYILWNDPILFEHAFVRGSSIDFDFAVADALHGADVFAPAPDDHARRAERDLDLDLRVATNRHLYAEYALILCSTGVTYRLYSRLIHDDLLDEYLGKANLVVLSTDREHALSSSRDCRKEINIILSP